VESGDISRPMIGIRYININKEFATRNNLPVDGGALIYASGTDLAVLPGTPAAQAGLVSGDIITKIGDDEIKEGQSLISILYKYKPGDKVTITYVRDDKTKTAEIILAKSD
jgi:putative serine protease PepD